MSEGAERAQARAAVEEAREKWRRTRARVRAERKRWQKARRAVARGYRAALPRARARWRAWKAAERERIRRQLEVWKTELRARWAARRAKIDELGQKGVARARLVADHERLRARELALHRRQVEHRWRAHRHRERLGESDDQVRTDLGAHHPELVLVFNRSRRAFKAGPSMSRTESVLHWAHDHPEEVMALTSHAAEVAMRKAIREHEQAERAVYRAMRKTRPAARRTAKLADVPF